MRPAGRLTGCRRRQRGESHKGKRCHGDVTGGRGVRRGVVGYGTDAVWSVRERNVVGVTKWYAGGSVWSTVGEIEGCS